MATGAVISGRRTFELAKRWQGDHHDGVPVFVLTRQVDDGDVPPGHARFVTDVEDCARLGHGSFMPPGRFLQRPLRPVGPRAGVVIPSQVIDPHGEQDGTLTAGGVQVLLPGRCAPIA
jgi:hypothetical protein